MHEPASKTPAPQVIAIDIPIGLLYSGTQDYELQMLWQITQAETCQYAFPAAS
jgi:hypothetical protein